MRLRCWSLRRAEVCALIPGPAPRKHAPPRTVLPPCASGGRGFCRAHRRIPPGIFGAVSAAEQKKRWCLGIANRFGGIGQPFPRTPDVIRQSHSHRWGALLLVTISATNSHLRTHQPKLELSPRKEDAAWCRSSSLEKPSGISQMSLDRDGRSPHHGCSERASQHTAQAIAKKKRLKNPKIVTKNVSEGANIIAVGALDPADRPGSDPRDGPSSSDLPPPRHPTPSLALNPSRVRAAAD
jgi:hypothetical protein